MPTIEQLSQIPYLDISQLHGRFIPTLCFYDDGWHFWISIGENGEQLIDIKPVDAAEMVYFANSPAKETDVCWQFLNFLCQRASSPNIGKAFYAIRDDIENLSASLAKVEFLQNSKEKIPEGLSRMATTEVEYIVMLCRGLFDFLQEFLKGIWEVTILSDQSIQKRPLKDTFREMVTFKGQPADITTITKRFGLPENLAKCYIDAAEVFFSLRKFRDKIVHHGSRVQSIYHSNAEFQIASRFAPMPHLNVWYKEERGLNDLVPLLPALQVLIAQTMRVCDDFAATLQETFQFPPSLAPNMSLYIRSYFTCSLSSALATASKRSVFAATD